MKLERISNKYSEYYAGNLEEFKGSNLRGEFEEYNGVQVYCVYSYQTLMAAHVKNKWLLNTKKYSRTTSKQMKQLNIIGDHNLESDYQIKEVLWELEKAFNKGIELFLCENKIEKYYNTLKKDLPIKEVIENKKRVKV